MGFFTPARYSITCEKEGYGSAQRTLKAGMNGWYAGNLIVDPATGAMLDIKEHHMVLNLPKQADVSQVPIPLRRTDDA